MIKQIVPMVRLRFGILSILLIIWVNNVISQDTISTHLSSHSINIKAQYLQLDDQVNFGYVFDGIGLILGYRWQKETGRVFINYQSEIGFGVVNNLGHGFYWKFKPLDFFHGFKVDQSSLILGPYIGAEYSWQQYDELQGGRLFWLSNIELGPEFQFDLPIGNFQFQVSISSSLLGLASRPDPDFEDYYYSFNFSEFISSSYRNAQFGSINRFNHSKFLIDFLGNDHSRFRLGYEFDYLGYFEEPKATFLTHSINLNWKL